MASWEEQTSPLVKFEDSPAESFLSAPGEMYSSLFAAATPTASSTVNPLDMMSPESLDEEGSDEAVLSALATNLDEASTPATGATEKKTTKKRKSWGQVLPEPKTNLPPRKRAKTEDEKEQRRVERVLRNRRAAQSSRERKRLETEALELRNKELEVRLHSVERANLLLIEELNKYRQNSGVVTRSSSPLDSLRSNPVTLSQELFSSQDGHKFLEDKSALRQLTIPDASNPTVDPASLSPELVPVPDEEDPESADEEEQEGTPSLSTDLTQHPAEMLSDLQCHQSVDLPQSWTASPLPPALAFFIQLQMLLLTSSLVVSACNRPLTQIVMSLNMGFPLLPTRSILRTIIWLVTRPSSRRSTSATSSTSTTTEASLQTRRQATTATSSQRTSSSDPSFRTLRLKSLRKIITCSPLLARPLQDATLEALRLVSEGYDDRVSMSGLSRAEKTRDNGRAPPECLDDAPLPSREALLTLLWALKVEERRSGAAPAEHPRPDLNINSSPTHEQSVLQIKRKLETGTGTPLSQWEKRCRFN